MSRRCASWAGVRRQALRSSIARPISESGSRGNSRHSEQNQYRRAHMPSTSQMPTGTLTNPALAQQQLDALDALSGLHPGFRPAHAKGLMCSGMFTPSLEAAHLTRAPHASRPSTAVTVRYSNSTGVPTIPDNDPARSGPRGIAIRFHLAEYVHTDI